MGIDNGNLPVKLPIMSLVSGEKTNFQFILRLLNTNVDGKQKVMYALTNIKGVGRRYSNLVCKKADVDLNKRAGELTSEELERIVTIIQNPTQYKIPTWFLNRQRDIVDGKDIHTLANGVDPKLREALERLKKIRAHRGLRHYWGLRVRGQHTKTTGRRGRTVGVSKRKGGYTRESWNSKYWVDRREGWVLHLCEHFARIAFGNTRLGYRVNDQKHSTTQ